MIGPAASNRLQITVWDNTTSQYVPDKAGAPVGRTLGPRDSFGALYEFNWSSLNQDEIQAAELVGFLGQAAPQTRQVAGTLLRHWKVAGTSDYYVAVDVVFGTVGASANFGYSAGAPVYLGTDPMAGDYKLGIGYCGTAGTLRVSLYAADGTELMTRQETVSELLGANAAAEINALALDHIGWSDYTYNGGDRATVWQVKSLGFFKTFDGAFSVAAGQPTGITGACCMPDGSCADTNEAACTTSGGHWQGGCVVCSQVQCEQPPCPRPFADDDRDGDVDMVDFAAFQECYTINAAPIPTRCRCFDISGDGRINSVDLIKFALCGSGPSVPAAPACAD
jgi:hypothetical protein